MKKYLFSFSLCFALIITFIAALAPSANAAKQGVDGLGPVVIDGARRDFQWPVPEYYNLQSCFYDTRNHRALDISAPEGTAVVAAFDGTVVQTKTDQNGMATGYGNYVVVEHTYVLTDGSYVRLYSKYNHLEYVSVSNGDFVTAGQSVLGGVGSTGYAFGPHLDFQIFYQDYSDINNSIDPYANELLELPANLEIYDEWYCGQDYYESTKTLYESTSESYLTACTFVPLQAYGVVYKKTYEKALPCSYPTDHRSITLNNEKAMPMLARVRITGLLKNTVGNMWYRVFYNGQTGYLYAGDIFKITCLSAGEKALFSIKGANAPSSLNAGQAFSIYGTVSTEKGTISKVTVGVYDASGAWKTGAVSYPDSRSFDIHNVDLQVLFDSLPKGTYYYRIIVANGSISKCLLDQEFTVI